MLPARRILEYANGRQHRRERHKRSHVREFRDGIPEPMLNTSFRASHGIAPEVIDGSPARAEQQRQEQQESFHAPKMPAGLDPVNDVAVEISSNTGVGGSALHL